MELFDKASVVDDIPVGARILKECAESGLGRRIIQRIPYYDLDIEGPGPRSDDVDGLGMTVTGDEEYIAFVPTDAVAEGHGLGSGGAFVQHRSVGDLESRQVDHHGLKIEKRFEAALRDLRLVRCVGRVPRRALEDVALYHTGRAGVVVPHAYE